MFAISAFFTPYNRVFSRILFCCSCLTAAGTFFLLNKRVFCDTIVFLLKECVFEVLFGEKVGFGKVGFGRSSVEWRILCENCWLYGQVSSKLDVRASSYGHVKICTHSKSDNLLDM